MALQHLNPNIMIPGPAGALLQSPQLLPAGIQPTPQQVLENVEFGYNVKRLRGLSGQAVVTDANLAGAAMNEHRVLDAATVNHGQLQQDINDIQQTLALQTGILTGLRDSVRVLESSLANQVVKMANSFVRRETDVIERPAVTVPNGQELVGAIPNYAGDANAGIFPRTLAAVNNLSAVELGGLRNFYNENFGIQQLDTLQQRVAKFRAWLGCPQ